MANDESNLSAPGNGKSSLVQNFAPRPPICGSRYKQVLENREVPLLDSDVARLAHVSRNTLAKIRKNIPVQEQSIQAICNFLDINRADLELNPEQEMEGEYILPPPSGWKIVRALSPIVKTDNGVYFRIVKLQNNLLKTKFARGKLYDLYHVPPERRQEKHAHLLRHAQVCELVGNDGRLASNLDVKRFKDECAWWVLDRWIEGEPLSESISQKTEPLHLHRVIRIGSEILHALAKLHSVDVIMRELTPDRIYVDADSVTLTDFELAKLVHGSISVRGDWTDECPYRAPEVSEFREYTQSDIYSWARVMSFVLTGNPVSDFATIPQLVKYPKIQQLLKASTNSSFGKRPKTTTEVLDVWSQWNV